ncbi:unnamed protein product [Owenia fusiformis]|uniref:Uncharacterized protein n=1 Tax=Owenia fusiformis TaxID=6347 RepID=A0A8S4Q8D1_OWEFU|nr:unnamed protein product [Owenia fusiformis]
METKEGDTYSTYKHIESPTPNSAYDFDSTPDLSPMDKKLAELHHQIFKPLPAVNPHLEFNSKNKCYCTMTTPIAILWTLLSVMVAGTCTFSFMQPFWVVHPKTFDSLGMYTYCVQDKEFINESGITQTCGIYGGDYFSFSKIPSSSWQASSVLYGGGCLFLCMGALFATISLCLPNTWNKKLAIFSGYVQCVAVLIMIAGLVVHPVGLGSQFVQQHCPGSGMYNGGHCQLGWAYMLGIMGTSLSMFCPFLSQYIDMKVHDYHQSFV